MAEMNLSKETEKQGVYATAGTWYGAPYSQVTKLNAPITPRENMKRYLAGKSYLWIPDALCDQVDITPDNIPDVVACGYEGGIDSFGVEWVPLQNGLPSFVKPGDPKLKDITDWRNLPKPDVDSWDWEGYGKLYTKTLGEDRFVRGVLLSGYFERLISLMDFGNAAMALLDEPDEVSALFAHLTDYNIAIAEHYKKYFHADGVMLHDDWASQRSPFFSLDTVRRLIVPHMKRLVDRVHEIGLVFTHHCCGNCFDLIPASIETGADTCQLQENTMDIAKAIETYGSKIVIEGYWSLPESTVEEVVKQFVTDIVKKMGSSRRGLYSFYETLPDRSFDAREYAYREARKLIEENL
ncbi:MAG: hypothetical protein LBN21_03215 [Treponema sp.]|jgi:hypothetical protein|nr:hypothetical protein [Treponema sp.]